MTGDQRSPNALDLLRRHVADGHHLDHGRRDFETLLALHSGLHVDEYLAEIADLRAALKEAGA